MKKLFCILLFSPLFSTAQSGLPRFENDTLYTTSGFKMYKGIVLKFGKGSGRQGRYKHINIKSGAYYKSLVGSTLLVNELKNFGISVFYNGYIELTGTITFKDASTGYLDIHMSFDRAIENSLKLTSELDVPLAYRNQARENISDALIRIYKLYINGDLTEDEYEDQRQKILDGL